MNIVDYRNSSLAGLDLRESRDTHFLIGDVGVGENGPCIRMDRCVNCQFDISGTIGYPTEVWTAWGYDSKLWQANRGKGGIVGHDTTDCVIRFGPTGRIGGMRNGMSVNGVRLRVEGTPGAWTIEGIWSDFIWTRGTDVSFVNVSGRSKIDLPESPHQNTFQVGKGSHLERFMLWGARFELRNFPDGFVPTPFKGGGAFILPGEDTHTDLFIGNSRITDTGIVAIHLSNVDRGIVRVLEITAGTRVGIRNGSRAAVTGIRYLKPESRPAWPPADWDMTEPAAPWQS